MSNEVPPAEPPAPAQPQAGGTGFDVDGIRQQIADGTSVHFNAKQDLVIVFANVATLRLQRFEQAVADRYAWRTPAGLTLGLLSALITIVGTRDFELFKLNRDTWIGAFGLATLAAVAWTAVTAPRAWRQRNGDTVEGVVRDLAKNQP